MLKALGATDRQAIAQYAVEVLCICLVAAVLATGTTALVSQKMGDWLLSENQGSSEAAVAESQPQGGMPVPGQFAAGPMGGDRLYKEGGRFSLVSSGETVTHLEVVYRGGMLLYGILVLLAISLLGMAVPVIWIARLRPAQVLSME